MAMARLFTSISILVLFLAGCGGQAEVETSIEKKPDISTVVDTGREAYALAEKVELSLTVTNHDVEERRLFLNAKKPYVFEIKNFKGITIWKSQETGGGLELVEFYLPALDKKVYHDSWVPERLPLGEYSLIGYVPVAENLKGYRDSTTFYLVD